MSTQGKGKASEILFDLMHRYAEGILGESIDIDAQPKAYTFVVKHLFVEFWRRGWIDRPETKTNWIRNYKNYFAYGITDFFERKTKEEKMMQDLIRLLYILRLEDEFERTEIFPNKKDMRVEHDLFQYMGWERYFNLETFDRAIDVTRKPKVWLNLLHNPGVLREPFTLAESPIQSYGRVTDYADFFPGSKGIEIPGGIFVAHTLVDVGARRLADISFQSVGNEFEVQNVQIRKLLEFYIEHAQNSDGLLRAAQSKTTRLIRVERIGEAKLILHFQPTTYEKTAITNFLVQASAYFESSGIRIIEVLCPQNDSGERTLPPLDDCGFSNHLGITCIVITNDGYFLMFDRSPRNRIDGDSVGFATSSRMGWRHDLSPFQDIIEYGFEEIGFANRTDFLKGVSNSENNQLSSRLLYLGITREWSRGGKPELFCLGLSKLSLNEHKELLIQNRKYSNRSVDRLINPDRLMDDPYRFQIRGGPGNFASAMTKIERLLHPQVFDRGVQANHRLQEAAKGGLSLLYYAYADDKNGVLQAFLREAGCTILEEQNN